jgi:hypothetical protein
MECSSSHIFPWWASHVLNEPDSITVPFHHHLGSSCPFTHCLSLLRHLHAKM